MIDTLLINGKIYTMKEEGDRVEAIGIDKGRVVFAGDTASSSSYTPKQTIDLKGRAVFPGFGDSHLHFYAWCQNQATVRLEDVKSLEEMISLMKRKASVTEKGKWIKGTGFDHTKFSENRMPTRHDLDRISSEHPIVIRRCCLHAMAANSLAVQRTGLAGTASAGTGLVETAPAGQAPADTAIAGQASEDQAPAGRVSAAQTLAFQVPEHLKGLIELDPDGTMNGIFHEEATDIFDEIVPNPLADPREKKRVMADTFRDMVSKGLTSFHTYVEKVWSQEESLETYRELERDGALPLRVVVSQSEWFERRRQSQRPEVKDPYHKVRYGSYKLFTDGSLGARSAALTEPYSDDPGNRGILADREELIMEVRQAFRKGLQPAVHAIGDRALDLAMDAVETAVKEEKPAAGLPVRIIHAQVVRRDQMERLKRLPVVLDVQPVFLCTDLYWIESRLGKERIADAYLWKTLMKNGLILAGGSDCPVEAYDPLKGIYAAVTRQDVNGFPPGGWQPEEKLSVYEALCLFTKNVARTIGDEDVLGTIEPGKFADLTVLEEDPFEVPAEKLKDIQTAMTFVAGELAYQRK